MLLGGAQISSNVVHAEHFSELLPARIHLYIDRCCVNRLRCINCFDCNSFPPSLLNGPKNVPLYFCPYLRQKSTDYQNFFTGAFCGQLAINLLLNIPPHVNCVTILPSEIQMQEKLTNNKQQSC